MNLREALVLVAAATTAGAVNAVAGGGTLLTFPALLFVGTNALVANVTSTVALVIGTAGSVFGFRKQIVATKSWLARFLPVSLAGGLLGGILLTRTAPKTFATLVPFLLLFATLIFLSQNFFRRFAGGKVEGAIPPRRSIFFALVFQFLVALYGGYFGAGIGILMLASLGFLGFRDIHEMNGLKNILGSLINFVAAIYFIFTGLVDWPKALVMTAGALAGYFLGAHFSQRIPQARVRQLITGIGFAISAWLFVRQFR